MKFSQRLVWKAVYEFVPSFRAANQNREVINLPKALEIAAIACFLEIGNNGIASLGTDRGYAGYIIQDTLKELQTVGWMTFGSQEEYWG
jgi:hypothetical protein